MSGRVASVQCRRPTNENKFHESNETGPDNPRHAQCPGWRGAQSLESPALLLHQQHGSTHGTHVDHPRAESSSERRRATDGRACLDATSPEAADADDGRLPH